MADALKAEGNKLFQAKKFQESMYVLPSLVVPHRWSDQIA